MQHGAAFAHRMMAAGREHALDVAIADRRRLHVHGRGEQFARRAARRDRQHDAVDMHAGAALGLIDRVAQHLFRRRDDRRRCRPSCPAPACARCRAPRSNGCGAAACPAAGAASAARSRTRPCWCRCRARTRWPSAGARSASSWEQGHAPGRSRVAAFLLGFFALSASSRACASASDMRTVIRSASRRSTATMSRDKRLFSLSKRASVSSARSTSLRAAARRCRSSAAGSSAGRRPGSRRAQNRGSRGYGRAPRGNRAPSAPRHYRPRTAARPDAARPFRRARCRRRR